MKKHWGRHNWKKNSSSFNERKIARERFIKENYRNPRAERWGAVNTYVTPYSIVLFTVFFGLVEIYTFITTLPSTVRNLKHFLLFFLFTVLVIIYMILACRGLVAFHRWQWKGVLILQQAYFLLVVIFVIFFYAATLDFRATAIDFVILVLIYWRSHNYFTAHRCWFDPPEQVTKDPPQT